MRGLSRSCVREEAPLGFLTCHVHINSGRAPWASREYRRAPLVQKPQAPASYTAEELRCTSSRVAPAHSFEYDSP
eukprot:scaffold2173_cov416-Prasinococcus_capsulatus_cf.AAC.1